MKPDGDQRTFHVRARHRDAHVDEVERVRAYREVSGDLRVEDAEDALAALVLRRPVVDTEVVRLRRQLSVELERHERPRDDLRVDLADVPPHPRARVHAEVAEERREVHVRRVETCLLEPGSPGERIDDRVGQRHGPVGEPQRRDGALDDVAADGELAVKLLGEAVLGEADVVGLERSAQIGQQRVHAVADVDVEGRPAVGLGERGGALGQRHGASHAHVPVEVGDLDGAAGEHDVDVAERDLDAALVVDRQIARRGRAGRRVEIRRPDALQTPHEDRPRLHAHASVHRAQRVVVARHAPVGAHARPVHGGSTDAHRELVRGAGGRIVLHGDVEVDRARVDSRVVDLEVERRIGQGERVEGRVGGALARGGRLRKREVRELAVLHDDVDARLVDLDLVDRELARQQGEELRSDARPRALEDGGPTVPALHADARQLHREGPHPERDRIARDDPLRAQRVLGLGRGPGANPRRPDGEGGGEGNEPQEREHDAHGLRDPTTPVTTPAPAAHRGERRLARVDTRSLGVGRRHEKRGGSNV